MSRCLFIVMLVRNHQAPTLKQSPGNRLKAIDAHKVILSNLPLAGGSSS